MAIYMLSSQISFSLEKPTSTQNHPRQMIAQTFSLYFQMIKVTSDITYKLCNKRRLHTQNPVDSTIFGGPKTAPDSLVYTKWQVTDELLYELSPQQPYSN